MRSTISTGELRCRLADALNEARFAKNRIVIERNGEPVAAIVPLDDLEKLQSLEDEHDARLADEAKAEGGSVTMEEFKQTLDGD